MDRRESSNRFNLDDHFLVNNQICAETDFDSHTVVDERNRWLASDGQSPSREIVNQQGLVH